MRKGTQKAQKEARARSGLPTHEQIAARAYEIYLERGCQHGHDLDDWLQAEYELMQLPVRELAKLKPPSQKGSSPGHRSIIEVVRSALK